MVQEEARAATVVCRGRAQSNYYDNITYHPRPRCSLLCACNELHMIENEKKTTVELYTGEAHNS